MNVHPQCLSAVANCEKLCDRCRESIEAYESRVYTEAVEKAVRLLESHGYIVFNGENALAEHIEAVIHARKDER